nr:MAG TPA: hypothetical protein [Caudoviricetes sp.]
MKNSIMEQHIDIPCEEYSQSLQEAISEYTAIELNNTIIALEKLTETMGELMSEACKSAVLQAIMATSIKTANLYAKELNCKDISINLFWPVSTYYQWRYYRLRRKRIGEERILLNLKRRWKTLPDGAN